MIQTPEFRGLGHQTSAFRDIVRYLENTCQTKLYPRYKKTGASSLIRLGFHRSLIGGIAARPTFRKMSWRMPSWINMPPSRVKHMR